jgi:hypothetical protein
MIPYKFRHPILVVSEIFTHLWSIFRVFWTVSPLMHLGGWYFVIYIGVLEAGMMVACPFVKLREISTTHDLTFGYRGVVAGSHRKELLSRS